MELKGIVQHVAAKLQTNARTAVMVGTVGLMTMGASAQDAVAPAGGAPVALGDVVFPIDLTSIATVIGAAGALMIGLWATYSIGFRLVTSFVRKMGRVAS